MCERFLYTTLPPTFSVGRLEIRLSLSFSVELVFMCAILYTTVIHNITTHKLKLYTRTFFKSLQFVYDLRSLKIYIIHTYGSCDGTDTGLVSYKSVSNLSIYLTLLESI